MKQDLFGIIIGDLIGTGIFAFMMFAIRIQASPIALILLPAFFFVWILVMAILGRRKFIKGHNKQV